MKLNDWLAGSMYEAHSEAVGYEPCINLYPEILPPPPRSHGKSQIVFYGCPGLDIKTDFGTNSIRGSIYVGGRLFMVHGGTLREVYSDFTSDSRGFIAGGTDPVCMVTNGVEILIISGTTVYLLTLSDNTFITVSGLSLSRAVFGDGYFIGLTPDSQIIRISGQYDGATWDALDFTSAEGDPDEIVTLAAPNRTVWTFGEKSIEVFYDSGNNDFPYERIPGALIQEGCAAKDSVVVIDNAPFWLGHNQHGEGIFFRANGYESPIRISDHGIESILRGFSDISDCVGYGYREAGHSFVVWNFPTGGRTLVFDVATGFFHERAEWNGSVFSRHRAMNHVYAFGMHLMGDYSNGCVYEQSLDYYDDDNGSDRKWLRAVPIPNKNNQMVFPSNLELIAEVGKGVGGGAASVSLRYSKDGGYTFGSPKTGTLGAAGEYNTRCRWPGNLGSARKPYVEFSGTDTVKTVLIDAVVDIEQGTS